MAKKKLGGVDNNNVDFEYIDIKGFNLPLLDEPVPPLQRQYSKEHTKA
jgi:hypothetical protein